MIAPVPASERGSRPTTVVIADDEPDVRLLLRVQLEHAGFAVVGEAADGREVVAVARDANADAVVLDLLMPGTNGFEAIAPLRASNPAIAIVAYTAVAGDFVRKEMARLDVALLLKSGDAGPLIDKLTQLVAR